MSVLSGTQTGMVCSELFDVEPGLTDLAERIRALRGLRGPLGSIPVARFARDFDRLAAELVDVAKSLRANCPDESAAYVDPSRHIFPTREEW